jgi:hypothetical protein
MNKMGYMDEVVSRIKNAKTDDDIKYNLHYVYVVTQMDSSVRKEFDDWWNLESQYREIQELKNNL